MKRILPVIVLSQFFCTSLWFAGNAVIADMARQYQLQPNYLAYLTSAVQAGFITGTLIFALLAVSDRFLAGRVFLVCAITAALFNLGICLPGINSEAILALRFFTGVFLAGIYPVGMKIAADHYQQGLGKSLGYLVGALVLGTAFPHLLKSLSFTMPWQYVMVTTSVLSVFGGVAMFLLVPKGPYSMRSQKLSFNSFLSGFNNRGFRNAAFGYFGHMWELYAFWTFVPLMLTTYKKHFETNLNIPLLSFFIISSGALSCVLSGYISKHQGVKKTATGALLLSCICCVVSPLILKNDSAVLLIAFLIIWGMAVIADSPMFSTLIAQNAPAQSKGSALTIVNCIGFFITIISIQVINALLTSGSSAYVYVMLSFGPALALIALIKNKTA